MYRFLFRTVCAAGNPSVSVYESCVLTAKCDKVAVPVFRVALNALSTSSVRLCEKKDSVVPPNEDEKTNADKEGGPTETGPTKMAEERQEPAMLKMEDGSTTQQQMDVKTEHDVEKPTRVKTDAAKSGKESLLDLLGTMKLEVTNKRQLKNVTKNHYESTPRYEPKPAAMESTVSMIQKAMVEASSQSKTLDPNLVSAASAAASTLPNSHQAESELLRQLRQRKAISEAQMKGGMNNLGVLITDMKVGKNPKRQKSWSGNQIHFDDDGQGYTHDKGITPEPVGFRKKWSLFSGQRLNIFTPAADEDAAESKAGNTPPTLWDIHFANQLSQCTNQMPRNGFEEMIQWTKEGKLWQYPINNEAGLEEETSVPFHEHIFLEKHLEEGFPRQGPVRHFMELVVAGLSKNPYLTVEQKKEHISWFRDYFHQKEEVLNETDVYLN